MGWFFGDRESKTVGQRGEDLAVLYFKQKGWQILERNYNRRVGEIDVIGQDKQGVVHLVEVKTVKDVNPGQQLRSEERVGPQKIKRLKRVISIYLEERGMLREEVKWQVDIATVTLEPPAVEVFEDVIL